MGVYSSILLIGGNGMLARDLGAALARQGRSFVSVDRAECDITKPPQVHALFAKCQPTLVFNCAAYTAVDQCEDEQAIAYGVNGTAVGTIAEACREHRSKLVHFSTDFVFDGQSDRPYRPDDRTNPLSVYGLSKLDGEKRLQATAPPAWLVVRTAWLFGRNGPCFPAKIIELARLRKPLRVVNDQLGCPTYTVDLAEATLQLVDVDAAGLMHVTNTSPVTWHEFAAATLEAFGEQADLLPVTTAEWFRLRPKQAKRPAYSVLDVSTCEKLTGRPLRDWREALRDYRACFSKGA